MSRLLTAGACLSLVWSLSCGSKAPADRVRASGQVEATEVQVSALVGGRLIDLRVAEGQKVSAGDLIARLDTTDTELALRRAQAERAQAEAQLHLLLAGPRPEEVRQAEAQVGTNQAEVTAAEDELKAAQADLDRYEALLEQNSGSRKQRDDALTRRDTARAKVRAARERARASAEGLARIRAGARKEEIEAARARVGSTDAQIATLEKSIADASVRAPIDGVVTQKLADVGEILAARLPIVVIADLAHAWANVYVAEPVVPKLRLGQSATVFTDAGGSLAGQVSFISSKAEFTPRNVQTPEERSKLVYRVKIAVDNRQGILKQGMPVEAEIPFV